MKTKFINVYRDPAIGFPWVGKEGLTISFKMINHRMLGVCLVRRKYTTPTLWIGLWWAWEFELMWYCS